MMKNETRKKNGLEMTEGSINLNYLKMQLKRTGLKLSGVLSS